MMIEHKGKDITELIQRAEWSGSRLQAARKLSFTYTLSKADVYLPKLDIQCGETVYAFDDDGVEFFRGIVFARERSVDASTMQITAYDYLIYLNKSKTTKKFTDILAEDVARQVCKELGVVPGEIAETGVKVSFIADAKTGYEIIMTAYTEAAKTTKGVYMPMMNCGVLDVVEKGTLIEDYTLHAAVNAWGSTYKESIENMVNQVLIVDEQGNRLEYVKNDDWIKSYSMIQDVYKVDPNKNTQEAANKMLKGLARSGSISGLGNYDCTAGYGLMIADENFAGQFWIKEDSHSFDGGQHMMKLELEFENLMDTHEADQEKKKKKGGGKKSGKKKKKRSENPNAKKAKRVPLYMQKF